MEPDAHHLQNPALRPTNLLEKSGESSEDGGTQINMKNNAIVQWLASNKTALVAGFIFGAFVAPLLSSLGLGNSFFESLKPLLIGPMQFVGSFIPDVQAGPNAYSVPIHKWILALGFNGICYAIPCAVIFSVVRGMKSKRQDQ